MSQSSLARKLDVAQSTLAVRVRAGLLEPDACTLDGRLLFALEKLPTFRQAILEPISFH